MDAHTNKNNGLSVEGNTNLTGRLKVCRIYKTPTPRATREFLTTDGCGKISFVEGGGGTWKRGQKRRRNTAASQGRPTGHP